MNQTQRIEAFELSADIFSYPDENWFEKLKILSGIWDIDIPNTSLDDICSFYIEHFDINSSLYKTTPLASYWIDGKAFGVSTNSIETFYNLCGYFLKGNKSSCHISNMLNFCAILLKDNKQEEFAKFTLWLKWLKNYRKSLENLQIKAFSQTLTLCEHLLNQNITYHKG